MAQYRQSDYKKPKKWTKPLPVAKPGRRSPAQFGTAGKAYKKALSPIKNLPSPGMTMGSPGKAKRLSSWAKLTAGRK